jgi:hypothetical protein
VLGLLVTALFAGVPAQACRYSVFAGVPLLPVVGALALVPVSAALACATITSLSRGPYSALVAVSGAALPLLLLIYRSLLYRREPRHLADRRMQREFLVLTLVGGGFAMAVPFIAVLRLAFAANRDHRDKWLIG